MKPAALALLLFVAPGALLAQTPDSPSETGPVTSTPRLSLAISPETLAIGDRVEAVLMLETDAREGLEPGFPSWQDSWGDAEILSVEPPRQDGPGVWTQQLTLTVFEVGPATLPAIEVRVPRAEGNALTATTEPVVLEVASVLPAGGDTAEPAPPEPVRALPTGRGFWWSVALLGLACLALAVFVLRAARHIHRRLRALAVTPLEALEEALSRLRGESDALSIFTGLSLELRRYLGRAVGFPAAEGTTTEIQRRLRGRDVPSEIVRDTLALLREADQIKFARRAADAAGAAGRLDDAARLAQRVEQWLAPAADEPEEEAVA